VSKNTQWKAGNQKRKKNKFGYNRSQRPSSKPIRTGGKSLGGKSRMKIQIKGRHNRLSNQDLRKDRRCVKQGKKVHPHTSSRYEVGRIKLGAVQKRNLVANHSGIQKKSCNGVGKDQGGGQGGNWKSKKTAQKRIQCNQITGGSKTGPNQQTIVNRKKEESFKSHRILQMHQPQYVCQQEG